MKKINSEDVIGLLLLGPLVAVLWITCIVIVVEVMSVFW